MLFSHFFIVCFKLNAPIVAGQGLRSILKPLFLHKPKERKTPSWWVIKHLGPLWFVDTCHGDDVGIDAKL